MWRVLLADDHPVLRRGVASVIEALPDFSVVAEASNGFEAIDAIREAAPEIVLLDVSMPELDGLEVLTRAQSWARAPIFVVLTMHDKFVARAFAAGARGYLLKEDAVTEVEACLLAVAGGGSYVSHRLPKGIERAAADARAALALISRAERRILRLVAQHLTSREIAAAVSLSHRTVQNHRASMVRKLGLAGTSSLLKFALEHKDELERG